MHSHLVTIKVGIVGGTNERVHTNSGSLNENRLKCLNRETVQCRSTVQHDRVSLSHLLENIPDLGRLAINHLLGTTHSVAVTKILESADDERFEECQCHFLRQTTLVELKLWSNHNDGTSRIVYTLTE